MAAESGGFGEFVIESLIGEGGMGKVYRARQVALDRWVALKVLPRAKENQNFIERFYREARSAARLVHPNIIQIYTVGEHQGIPFFAMEYIEGEDLENIRRITGQKPSIDETLEIIRSAAKALAVAMEHGIVHRDIKPANIMITRTGLVKLMDFGLAKGLATDSVTQAGLVVGTPAYMSPEQGASNPVDTRSDIYSLGCVMYASLTGSPPYNAENVASLLYKHMYEMPEPLTQVVPDLNPEIEKICLKMMGKKPDERYQTPQQLLEALATIPCNPAAAELSLARRASEAYAQKRKPVEVRQSDLPVTAIAPMEIPHAPAPVRAAEPAPPVSEPRDSAPAASKETSVKSRPNRQLESVLRPPVSKLGPVFVKLSDGRWSYRPDSGQCSFAEGLAAELTSPPGEPPQGLGDCLLCSNWNKRLGCALAYCREVESGRRYKGLAAAVEQAIAWSGAQQFERAVAVLDDYIRRKPEDAEAYRELARIYEHPEYRARDKRRAIVLYERFIELAKENERFSNVDITRAQERAAALRLAPPEAKTSVLLPGSGVAFQCFYRGATACFGYGILNADVLCMARAGDVDPESGVTAAELGSAVGRASTLFRKFRSEQAKKEEFAVVKKELSRLSGLSLEQLQKDAACAVNVACDQMSGAEMSVDSAVGIRTLTVKTGQQAHLLFFTEAASFRAEQCHELLKRRLKAPPPQDVVKK
ncbi:MAG TPA: protein kinase [Planctomycetota bacterium]|jgi:serine/threonine-protein kinase